MKALQLIGPRQFRLTNLEKPEIDPDEVLIKVSYAGICGSDLHTFHGENKRIKYPAILGHEMSGEIVEIGAACPERFQVGDKVTINPFVPCETCPTCRSGNRHLCGNRFFYGMTKNGGFAEYMKVRWINLHRIDESVPIDVAAMSEPYAVGVHAVNRSGLKLGDKVIIIGGGPIGMMTALAARTAGAGLIAISEVSEYRLARIEELGFIAIDGREGHLREKVLEMTDGIGADIVFEAAGAQATSLQMTQILRARGTAVIVALYSRTPQVDLNDVNFRELTIKGTVVYTEEDFKHAVQTLPVEALKKLISHRLPLEAAEDAFHAAGQAEDAMKILLTPLKQ
jgi:2-desacetyl-2-hydroxyethyl bacteriochlorophyllide A dehydrogenase